MSRIQKLHNLFESSCLSVFDEEKIPKALFAAVQYAMFSGGKRIRPLLAMCVATDLETDALLIAEASCALEAVHAASLIHDDLPALDNDDFRRGKPSCHKMFDEATAILSGDFLNAYAFSVISNASALSKNLRFELQTVLAKAIGDLCSGQKLDIDHSEKQSLYEINRLKTGALFAASAEFGSIVRYEDNLEKRKTFHALGEKIGVVFQIADDFEDQSADKARPSFVAVDKKAREQALSNEIAAVNHLLAALEKKLNLEFSCTREIFEQLTGLDSKI
jgi:farnesyl diphosphate synthase